MKNTILCSIMLILTLIMISCTDDDDSTNTHYDLTTAPGQAWVSQSGNHKIALIFSSNTMMDYYIFDNDHDIVASSTILYITDDKTLSLLGEIIDYQGEFAGYLHTGNIYEYSITGERLTMTKPSYAYQDSTQVKPTVSYHFHRQNFITPRPGTETRFFLDVDITEPIMQPELRMNYPNPFANKTAINFILEIDTQVILSIYSISGQRISTLIDGTIRTGNHTIMWNATDENGLPVSANGTYFYILKADYYVAVREMFLYR